MDRRKINKLKLNKKGFTFVECVVAVALLAIVGTLAFSMFNNSARYMSKAKKEEQKQAEVQTAIQKETYKIYVEGLEKYCYYLYPSKSLIKDYTVLNLGAGVIQTTTNYYVKITYVTTYGSVDSLISITPAPDKNGTQPGGSKTPPYTRYKVLSDAGSSHYVYIYNKEEANTENKYVPPSEEYVDK